MKAIAVIDLSVSTLSIYDVPEHWEFERIEEYLDKKGHHLSNCSWGEFDGTINDKRDE